MQLHQLIPTRPSIAAMLLGAAALLAACEQKPVPTAPTAPEHAVKTAQPTQPAQLTTPTAPEQPAAQNAQELTPDKLSPAQQANYDRAKAAQQELAATLLGAVGQAMQSGGPEAAIETCATKAPTIAEQVALKHKVHIGRTSFKLRNPKNSPPDWTKPYVQARAEAEVILGSDDGAIKRLSPIRIMAPCLQCHGPADALTEQVSSALKARYPEDQATGFALNDLRGWFWVEASTQAPTL